MNKIRHIDFYPDEFIAGVSGKLTPEQAGVYWMICTLIYSKSSPIDDDPKWLGNIMGGTHPRTINKVLNALSQKAKITRNDGVIMVERCLKEIAKTDERIAKATANGRKGGRKPKENNDVTEPGGLFDGKLTLNYQPPTNNHQHYQDAFDLWNQVAKECGLPIAKTIGKRKSKLINRLNDCGGIDGWKDALNAVRKSPYLKGDVNGFRASLDFMLQESSFTKVIEGNYDNNKLTKIVRG